MLGDGIPSANVPCAEHSPCSLHPLCAGKAHYFSGGSVKISGYTPQPGFSLFLGEIDLVPV